MYLLGINQSLVVSLSYLDLGEAGGETLDRARSLGNLTACDTNSYRSLADINENHSQERGNFLFFYTHPLAVGYI